MSSQAQRYLELRQDFAHYRRSYSLLHESDDGQLLEYRRLFTPDRAGCLWLEGRVLRPDGTAYHDAPDDGPWYLVTDAELVWLNHHAQDLLNELCRQEEP